MLHHNGCRRRSSIHSPVVMLLAILSVCGCQSLPRWKSSDESHRQASHLQDVQLKVMRYADEYNGALVDPLRRFASEAASPEERLSAQNWRISQATSAYTIASGPNPIINALDMIVLASLSRLVLEEEWVNQRYGQRAAPLLKVHRELEGKSWSLVDGVLNFEEMTQLRAIIEEWRALHPEIRAVGQIRFADFASIVRATPKGASHGASLFAIIGLDPMRSIDPAVREIEQTRVLAERSIFYLQRAPNLLDMQIERLVYELSVMPEAKQMLADASRVALAAEAVGSLSNNAPEIIATQRQAIIEEFTQALAGEQTKLRELLAELRTVLDSGTAASTSVGNTVQAVDALLNSMRRSSEGSAPNEARRPFDVTQYTAAMREITASARELHGLLEQLDTSSTSVERLADATIGDIRTLIDHIYWQIVSIVLMLAATVFIGVAAFRYMK